MSIKKIIFAGTPQFSVPCLQVLLDSAHSVCAVYTQPDRPAGRGRQLQASPVKQLALAHQIPVYQPTSLKNAEAQATLAALQADLMVVVAYGLLLPETILNAPRFGCINVHASILPRWRGAAPIQRAILAGDAETGITLMQMDIGLDTGAMLMQAKCLIEPQETGETLHDKLSLLGASVLRQAIDDVEKLEKTPQDAHYATYARKLEKAEAQLDWTQSALALERAVRAYNPFPMAQTTIAGYTLRIGEAQALPAPTNAVTAGEILQITKQGIDVATQDGILRLLKVQKAGGKMLSVADFLNGHQHLLT
ncbi:methionyl-tRNA formyltransferase [Beggiatoa alba B18LD]|uniref:Methionyl-tRNA formyltransferase n=1 Tax=Beggiatoa alba B18LD TaxID=395493 RepID=I3CFD8_9GAMM|nr:methionyl-tRNA formyltransferase [Beggiatoa alba]EIJ42331.1 methionyl-tRNA formyltransferase [Beggiatoa alba B18LD]